MKHENKDSDISLERVLVGVALILCAVIIAYNLIYESDIEVIEFNTKSSVSSENEEYTAYSAKIVEKININTADSEELKSLDNIGDKTAQAIIDYRGSIGGFSSIEQIMEIKGIGEKTFEAIKDYITVD